jgi:SAM-dependent methyltransferase
MPEVYDRRLGPAVFRPFAVEVAARAGQLPAGAVLELAAGTGVLTRELVAARPGAPVVATDLNPAMVAWGARAVPQARWLAADAQSPPFRDAAFALVACQFGVMFLPDRPAAFAAARRLLAPGGRLLFTTWDTIDRHGFERPFMAAVRRVLPDDPPLFLERVPHGYHDAGRIAADVRAGGFTEVEVETVTRTGHAPSAADLAVGYCTGSPVRAGLVDRGDLPALTAEIAAAFTDLVGPGPLRCAMSAHVVTARA